VEGKYELKVRGRLGQSSAPAQASPGDNLRFADIETLQTDPQGFLGFWDARAREIAKAEPNAGHPALARLQRLRPGTTTLITQNVDGLLIKAGCIDYSNSMEAWHARAALGAEPAVRRS
jgi:hypothetical protein